MATTTRPRGNDRSALVVEDDAGVAKMLGFALRRAGFTVERTVTGQAALDALRDHPIDAVVLDLGLLDDNAGAVLRWLQSRGGRPRWVAISALDAAEAAVRYGPLNGKFEAKPFDPADLLERLGG